MLGIGLNNTRSVCSPVRIGSILLILTNPSSILVDVDAESVAYLTVTKYPSPVGSLFLTLLAKGAPAITNPYPVELNSCSS